MNYKNLKNTIKEIKTAYKLEEIKILKGKKTILIEFLEYNKNSIIEILVLRKIKRLQALEIKILKTI